MWELLTSAVTPFLVEALAPMPGERILDIGCGTGAATMRIATAVGADGAVVGIDISRPVIDEATRRMTCRNVSLQVADAQRDPVAGGPFTAAMSQFGVMFFDDPVGAFTNIHRHLAASGRLCFTSWQAARHNPWSFAAQLADLLPRPAAATEAHGRPGPFSLADPDHVRRVLEQSGFHAIDVTARSTTVVVPEETVVDDTELALMGVPVDRLPDARVRVRQELAPHRDVAGLLRLPLAFLVVTARG